MKFTFSFLAAASLTVFVAGCEHHGAKAELSLNTGDFAFKADGGDGSKTDIKISSGGVSVNAHGKDGEGIKLEASDKDVKVKANDNGNSFENNLEITAEDVTIPLYPGSEPLKVASLKASTKEENVWVATRTTSDAPSKVIEFYEDKLDHPTRKVENGKIELKAKNASGDDIGVSVEAQDGGKTTVAVARTVKKRTQ